MRALFFALARRTLHSVISDFGTLVAGGYEGSEGSHSPRSRLSVNGKDFSESTETDKAYAGNKHLQKQHAGIAHLNKSLLSIFPYS